MRNPSETVFSANSPPIILDLKMSEQLDIDPDFEFFDSTALNSTNSPSQFVDDIGPDTTSQFLSNLLSPKKQSHLERSHTLGEGCQSSLSMSLVDSPAGSFQDSSSESSDYPRKSSSASLTSGLTPGDIMMGDGTALMGGWNNIISGDEDTRLQGITDGCVNPSAVNTSFVNENSFNQDFDFGNSASSPSFKAGLIGMESPEISSIRACTQTEHSAMSNAFKSENTTSHLVMPSTKKCVIPGSREVSPLSNMKSNRGSPLTFFPSPSPGSASLCSTEYVNGNMFSNSSTIPKWAINLENFQNHGFQTTQSSHMHPRTDRYRASMTCPPQSRLTIHPTPLKSRVETQIPIKMTLFPLPAGITKLHLPTHTISKPKLLAKPIPERSPDTLELFTSLVCTSAMQNPEVRKRAFERAAASSTQTPLSPTEELEEIDSDESDENKPINGGEVKICGGCIIRERKRAARKKAKKVEEEESWQKYETQRVIVFNTHEVKDWQTPSQYLPSELIGDHPEPYVPEGSMQVDAPMRIACYCRHQNEKVGFQVIFTIKDHQDKLIAQAITSSIMITDDHKTSAVLSTNNQTSSYNDFVSGSGQFGEISYDVNSACVRNPSAFRTSYSSSDLQNLQQRSASSEISASSSTGNSPCLSYSNSVSATPRNSRQTSPFVSQGPLSKKRKSSGTNKLPSTLAMTRLEKEDNNQAYTAPSTIPSPFTPSFPSFPVASDQQFNLTNSMQNISTHLNGPPTPNSVGQIYSHVNKSHSMENLVIQPIYNTPAPGVMSRASSPNGMRLDSYQRQQAQLPQAVPNGFYGIPMSLNTNRLPIIHKIIPSEGPKAGGIEVTCLGIGFVQGLEVMFGDMKATTTTFWGETSLVCLLPPSSFAGNYPVTFKHQQQQMQTYTLSMPKQQTYFKYVDDDELQILRTALSVLGHKMTGKMEDVHDLARRIVGDSISNWGTSSIMNSDGSQIHGGPAFSNASADVDLETVLLKILDLIDLDDSPHLPRYNLRRASGQTMLHLASSLGFHRFVAALLARGANPDPKDKGGFTPMYFAALNNHAQIVRRLLLSGADPAIQSFQRHFPSDLSKPTENYRATQDSNYHLRRRSGCSQKSKISSITSPRSNWKSEFLLSHIDDDFDLDLYCGVDNVFDKYEKDFDPSEHSNDSTKLRRCPSMEISSEDFHHDIDSKNTILEHSGSFLTSRRASTPSAATLALRDQITAHIQQLQQMLSIPHVLQMPRFDLISQIPALYDYQAYFPNPHPMVRRITNFCQRPGCPKEQDHKWWDLFSSSVPSAPPAYDEIFPKTKTGSKIASVIQTTVDSVENKNCFQTRVPQNAELSSQDRDQQESLTLNTVCIGNRLIVSPEQQEKLKLARGEKSKRLSRDRKLFFIWIPLLIAIILAMIYNRVPAVWSLVMINYNHNNFLQYNKLSD